MEMKKQMTPILKERSTYSEDFEGFKAYFLEISSYLEKQPALEDEISMFYGKVW
jgi:hypothetical protein